MKIIVKYLIVAVLLIPAINSCKTKEMPDPSNPLLSDFNTPFNLPPFEKIMARHYMPAFEYGMKEGRRELEKIISDKSEPTFENTIVPFDELGKTLNTVSMVFYAQAQANTSDSLQKIEMEIMPKLTAFQDEIKLNPELFKRIRTIYEKQAGLNLNDEQKFYLENTYKGFVRNGANLGTADQDTLKALNQRLSVLSVKYSQNVMEEINNYKLFITRQEDLKGLPMSVVSSASEQASASGFDGKWAFTLQRPSIFPFLMFSESREKRKELYSAYNMRGNNDNEYDNKSIIAEIVALRARRANLLGYASHSSLVLEPRMAKNPENVLKLLDNLWERALPVAVKERNELQMIASKENPGTKIEAYDWWYYAEKVRKEKYNLNDGELRQYFNVGNVMEGAFAVAGKLFGITFSELKDAPLPHPEAQAFEVKEADGTHLGVLYMDFHPRDSKQQGAWCGTYRTHHIENGTEIKPVVTTVFNFTRPTGDTPALLNLEEASTLFHEFGHALDALMNRSTYNQTFIAWDFVEVPSQILEHWATEPEVLAMYARHYKTGETIPSALVNKIKNSGYFNQGFETVEYLAASLLDIEFHTLDLPDEINVPDLEKNYLTEIGLIPEISPRYRSTFFLHIAGGYDSGYYSYIWAAVLDNDAYEAFRENGIFDKTTADSFRKNILEKNGLMDAMEMFVNFRGREPVIEPLLKNRGLDQ